jgi:hypothetical protein
MAMGSPQESYDPETASWVLHSIGEDIVSPAQKNLLSRGVLSRRFKNPNSHPGRMLKISDMCASSGNTEMHSNTDQAWILQQQSKRDRRVDSTRHFSRCGSAGRHLN